MPASYVKKILVPTLRKGEMVVLDNLSSHKVAGVKEWIESAGAEVLYLPPCHPGFNPMDLEFSKLKTMLRKLKSRTMEDLGNNLGKICDIFSKKECCHYFKHAGYRKNMNVQTNS